MKDKIKNRELFFHLIAFFLILISASPVYADRYPESFPNSCQPGLDDTGCWQAAIDKAAASPRSFGMVVGNAGEGTDPGKVYKIKDTIYICNSEDGVIDGRGATFEWSGPSNIPMFLVVNSNHMRFTNMYIISGENSPYAPLQSAFEFTSAPSSSMPSFCSGSTASSSKNSIEHVTVQGTSTGGLEYGVRFTDRYNYDANNDMSTIIDSNFYNVDVAAVSIEHSQSHQHRLISVNGISSGNDGCFVRALKGFVSVIGGFQHNWKRANFCFDGAFGPFSLIDTNSEGSNRLLEVGNPGEYSSFPVQVTIQGGRFTTEALADDGHVVSFNRLGNLQVRGLKIKGNLPDNKEATIAIQPSQGTIPGLAASAIIEGVIFNQSSNDKISIIAKQFIDLSTTGNLCLNSDNRVFNCLAPLRIQ
jgi:hypothetical protein